MIKKISFNQANEQEIAVDLLAYCQNPTLNPMQLVEAIRLYAPQIAPDFAWCCRNEIYDGQNIVFR